ncbi:S9 family peptidase [Sphingomonas sp. LT1P40]|uniref:S9 family peptidase n=1 Tax=Alteristakelama amylovorans TaxID=3096166 RepID=UPI002FCB3EEC
MARFVNVVLAVLSLAIAPAKAQQPAPVAPGAAELAEPPAFKQPRLSPDGKRVAAGIVTRRTPTIFIWNLRGSRDPIRVPLAENNDVEWIRWVGNDRLIAGVTAVQYQRSQTVIRVSQLVLFDLTKRQIRFVGPQQFDGQNTLLYVSSGGDRIVYAARRSVAEYPAVFEYDPVRDVARVLEQPRTRVWDWFVDEAGVVRAAIGADADKSWIFYRSAAGESYQRLATRSERAGDPVITALMPVAGSDHGHALAEGADGRFVLRRYDFATGSMGAVVADHKTVDIDTVHLADGRPTGISYTEDRAETRWLDADRAALQKRIDKLIPGKFSQIVSGSDDGRMLLIHSRADSDAGSYSVLDLNVRELHPFADVYPALTGKVLRPMKPVSYTARDGLAIRGYLTLPVGGEVKLPLIVIPHGGPFARDSWGHDPWVQYLAARGYAVLQPNFRGSTGFGRAFVEKGYGQWGRGMQDDIDDGVAWLVKQGTVDRGRVCIMGASFGGYAAMWAAVRNPEIYRCAISFAGISDVASMLRYDRQSFAAPRYARAWRDKVRGESDFDLDAVSPIKAVNRLNVPILIAHGDKDDNVPLYQSRRLHEALKGIGKAHEYKVYEGEGHGLDNPDNAADFLKRVGAFLDRHNPTGPPAAAR